MGESQEGTMTTEPKEKSYKGKNYKTSSTVFEEVGRLKVSDINTVVVSKCLRSGEFRGYSVTKYITSPEYTGWAKGLFIPEEGMVEFLSLFDVGDLEEAVRQKQAAES
jgi:hypothetical protein